MVTLAPLRAKAQAIAAPIPFSRPDPVTMATLPARERVSGDIMYECGRKNKYELRKELYFSDVGILFCLASVNTRTMVCCRRIYACNNPWPYYHIGQTRSPKIL